jgi:hypothetical protein
MEVKVNTYELYIFGVPFPLRVDSNWNGRLVHVLEKSDT